LTSRISGSSLIRGLEDIFVLLDFDPVIVVGRQMLQNFEDRLDLIFGFDL
jgi:hypothetical protein